MVYAWIGETLLGQATVANLGEIGFLERVTATARVPNEAADEVGRIDNILAIPGTDPLRWCAVETQAVYFSGAKMQLDIDAVTAAGGASVIPRGQRRPDFRSSAPKRLMPQLQIKVPTLRRWGKKTAVVVDSAFFDSLGPMRLEPHASNADIAWFVVACDDTTPVRRLKKVRVHFTTLDSAVEGLTAGQPVTQEMFESRIRARLAAQGL